MRKMPFENLTYWTHDLISDPYIIRAYSAICLCTQLYVMFAMIWRKCATIGSY